uniref:Uncharacterized protein n=1 Tax=Anguilla anguilla TaxID=7936 RepID=A0A0E9PHJ4_ANGAN
MVFYQASVNYQQFMNKAKATGLGVCAMSLQFQRKIPAKTSWDSKMVLTGLWLVNAV